MTRIKQWRFAPKGAQFDILATAMRQRLIIMILFVLTAGISGCDDEDAKQHAEFFVFGTVMEVSLWGADQELALQAFSDLQGMFQAMHRDWHAWEPGALTEINSAFSEGRAIEAAPDLIAMIRQSQHLEEQSGGRFNAAIGALVELWGFHTSIYPIIGPPPALEEIEALIGARPSSLDILIDGGTVSSTNRAVQLDFGGIAKGYAIDLAIERLQRLGVENAIVNAGGDLRVMGRHGERSWRVAVRDPEGGILGVIEAGSDEAIFTSGNYERFRQENQQRYPHILDPRNGWPVAGIKSVTVITDQGWRADAAATALIVAGPADWTSVAVSLGLNQVLVIDDDGKAWMTPRMAERIVLQGDRVTEQVSF